MKKYIIAIFLLVNSFAISSAVMTDDDSVPMEESSYYCPNLTVALYKGLGDRKTKGQVSELQKFLASYFNVKISGGMFGPATREYVIKFQKENNLPSYGTVGQMTRKKISEVCNSSEREVVSITDIVNNTATQLSVYKLYLNGSQTPSISTENVLKEYAYTNCKTNIANNPAKSVRCTWNGDEVYSSDYQSTKPSIVSISFSKAIESKGGLIKIKGSNFSPYSNSVKIGDRILYTSSSDSNSLITLNTSEHNILSGTYVIQVKTKDGESNLYTFKLIDGGSPICHSEQYLDQNGVCKDITHTCPDGRVLTGFQSCEVSTLYSCNGIVSHEPCNTTITNVSKVPLVSIIEKPVLKLGYDSSNKESSLTSLFSVKVTAGTDDMMISKPSSNNGLYPNSYYFTASLDRNINYSGESMSVFSNNAIDNGSHYLIKAGQSATFNVTKIFKPAKMFADVYSAQLSLYSYAAGSVGSFVNMSTTNSVTIVGETSPYISGASDSDGYITITGARLNLADNYLQIDGMGNSLVSKFNPTSSSISIKKSDFALTSGLSVGFHTINITNTQTGNSNNYGLEVKQAITTPTISTTPVEAHGPNYNAMSCSNPAKSGLSTGSVACYGIWDYGNEFGGDPDMCPPYGYSSTQTGCKVQTKACSSGQAVATRVVKPTSMDINSSDIATFATNLKSTKEAVKQQIPTLWEYTCDGGATTTSAPTPTSVVEPISVKWGPQSNTPFNAGTSATAYSISGGCYSWTTIECGNSNVQTSGGQCVSGSRYSTDYKSVTCPSVIIPTSSTAIEAIAFGVYEGGPSWPRAEESVYLAIPTSAQGKVLVLTAYEQVNWVIRNPNNVTPSKIIAIGYKAQRVTSGDGTVLPQVESNSYTTNKVFQFAYQSNDTYFTDLVKWLATKNIKLTASNFTGSYSAKTNTIFAKPVVALGNDLAGQVLGASTVCADISRNLHRGIESSSVTTLQNFLKSKGLLNNVTGFYGDKTIEAVKDYQASIGLIPTGMVYEVTRQAVRDETCQ